MRSWTVRCRVRLSAQSLSANQQDFESNSNLVIFRRILMTFTTAHLSISLDGFVAGPNQRLEEPIGDGGMRLHQWHFEADQPGCDIDARWTEMLLRPRGAYLMGRNMFGPVRGPWSSYGSAWSGWWGDEPPTTHQCSSSPITHIHRFRCKAEPRSTSSLTDLPQHCNWLAKPEMATSTSLVGHRWFPSTTQRRT